MRHRLLLQDIDVLKTMNRRVPILFQILGFSPLNKHDYVKSVLITGALGFVDILSEGFAPTMMCTYLALILRMKHCPSCISTHISVLISATRKA